MMMIVTKQQMSFKKLVALAVLVAMVCATLVVFPNASYAATSAVIRYDQSMGERDPNVFGGAINVLDGASDVDALRAAGVTMARRDVYLSQILPNTTVAQYLADMSVPGGVDDPSTWDWSQYAWVDTYHNKGMKNMLILSYNVAWLSSSNTNHGVPKNWVVYEDIIKKIMQHFAGKADYIEVWNEPDHANFLDLTNSGYTSRLTAYKDIYRHAANAIRSVNATIPIGGPVLSNTDTSWADAMLKDATIKPNVNFLSYHQYQQNPDGEQAIVALRNVAAANGVPDMPIYLTEWNWDWQYIGSPMNNDSVDAIPYVAQRLGDMIYHGVAGAAYFAFNKQTTHPDFYSIYANGNLTPKLSAYRLLSKQLGLGDGKFLLRGSNWSNGAATIVARGATNAAGHPVAWVVNTSTAGDQLSLSFQGLKPGVQYTATAYEASRWQDATSSSFTTSFTTDLSGNGSISFWLPYKAVVGLKLTEQDSRTNLALQASAAADSHVMSGFEAGKATDGNDATRWASAYTSGTHWLTMDLGAAKSFNEIDVYWETAYSVDYTVQVSANNSSWTTVQTVTGNQAPGWKVHRFPLQNARYIKINSTAAAWGQGVSIFSVNVYRDE